MPKSKKRLLSKTPNAHIVLGVAIVTLMVFIGMTAFMNTNVISVEGASVYTVDEIVKATGLSTGDNLIFINTQDVSQKIRNALPFVSAAEITRRLPDTVIIKITESHAVARVAFAGDTLVIDATARVLARGRANALIMPGIEVNNLIEIRGVDIDNAVEGRVLTPEVGAETKLLYIQDILAAFVREDITDDVSYLDVSNITNIHFGYLDIYRVVLGRIGNLRHNLGRLPDSVEFVQHRSPNTVGTINMSDPYAEPRFTPGE